MERISDERFIELMKRANHERYLRISEKYRDEVPECFDRAAERAFGEMAAWVAAGAIPSEPPQRASLPKSAATSGIGARILAVVLSAAVIGGAGYAAVPAVRNAVNGVLGFVQTAPAQAAKQAADYIIPSPGEGYELREDVTTDNMAVKWFVAERRLLLVQIADELPELPTDGGETVTVGGTAALAYDIEGDQQLVLLDNGMIVLMKMYNASREELLDYAEIFAAANGI